MKRKLCVIRMNFVPCVAWVARGIAAATPEKLQLSAEELKRLVQETKGLCGQTCNNEDDIETVEAETNENHDIQDDFESRYNLDSYDDEDNQNPVFTINDLVLHVDNHDDEYISDNESEAELEEKEDFTIKKSDNLLVVGHVEDESSVLEIYVYNQEEDSFYVHHDIVLPSYPLALEWLDFNPSAEETTGNYIAIGDMGPVIHVWDLDTVDVLEPDYAIGKISKKKKSKKIKTETFGVHSDAVLSLSWNKLVKYLLASGSADSTVILWDLQEGKSLNQLSYHSNKVQALQWHPSESSFLLSGCTDGFLKLFDCRSPDGESKSWSVKGEIERVTWNLHDHFKFFCSTDQGYIHSVDMRNSEIEYSFQAHKEAVTGLDMSASYDTTLVSASMDRTLKLWDIKNEFQMMKSYKLKVGSIYTARVASDLDLTVAVGGNYSSDSLKVIDLHKEISDHVSKETNESKKIKIENKDSSTEENDGSSSHEQKCINSKKFKKHKFF